MLGKQIAELGNQSQELQNKLDAKYIDVKKVVNLMVDNLIAEGIRKARKLDEHIEELQEKVTIQKERKTKYEIKKQEFYERFDLKQEIYKNAIRINGALFNNVPVMYYYMAKNIWSKITNRLKNLR